VLYLRHCLRRFCVFNIALSLFLLSLQTVNGDQTVVKAADGKPVAVRGKKPDVKGAKPGGDKKEADKKEADKKKAGEEKKESPEPKVIRRDDSKDENSDPDELTAKVGEDGRVAFQFRNQPWVELVQWLAEISDQPLDWLELPADRINMRSPGRYTVKETRDLFNRHLLARGYTLLEIDGGLTVAKTASINPAIVPRVDVANLSDMAPHTFVRTSLDVGWLSAEKLAEELKPMISANGKLTALKTTNRIEAMDAATNLAQIAKLLEQEHSSSSREALAPEVKLRYLSAVDAKEMLEQFLGVVKKKATPLTPQQIQLMQQQRQRQPNKTAPPQAPKVEIAIVANPRTNSIIIRAPADRVAIAMEFLKRIDVPGDSMTTLSDIQNRVQVFRLASLDPEKLIEIVGDMNVLEPTTQIRADKSNNALIVAGSAADRYIIDKLIERLDGSGRSFEVLPLRRLDPEEVAESIAFLMGQDDEDDNKNSRQRYYSYYNRNSQDDDKNTDKFRVAANVRNRQVLLWANEQEMNEVRSLLVKLGELPPPGGNRRTVRVIDASATPETYEYLQKLKEQFKRISPNSLELPDAELFKDPNLNFESDEDSETESKDESEEPAAQEPDLEQTDSDDGTVAQSNRNQFNDQPQFHLAVVQNQTDENEAGSPADKRIRSSDDFDRAFRAPKPTPRETEKSKRPPANIKVEVDSDGNLVLVSPDTDALDQLENLMLQVAPPKRPYHVFHIEHASAFWMRLNLEDYYDDLMEDDSSDADNFYRYYWGNGNSDEDEGPTGLGKGAKLRFVDDPDTNTLVVTGGSTQQLRTIAELIELWDVPEPVNKRKTRFTDLISIQFGQAQEIADTVKEAYRDLLSSNDKAFAARKGQGQGDGQKQQAAKNRNGGGSGFRDSDGGQDAGGANFSFKGKLSIGVDNIGNTLLISAEGEPLLNLVKSMVDKLDEAARPAGEVQVIQIPGGISGRSLQLALQTMGADPPDPLRSSNRQDNNVRKNNGNRRDRAKDGKNQEQPINVNVDVGR
jgi:type II secretory pathway component GspD/PulD (secretin)